MHLRGQRTTFQTRLEISEHTAAGWNDTQIATTVGCSVWTVRKWRRRALHQGRISLTSQMGRPATGPMSTFPSQISASFAKLSISASILALSLATTGVRSQLDGYDFMRLQGFLIGTTL